MLRNLKKGQSAIEYVAVLVIVIGAFVAMQNYMKRGFQGRWRDAVDGLGDQYDPQTAITNIRHTLNSQTNTEIFTITDPTGYWTMRFDNSASQERKTGTTAVGAY